ncbi:restriction endonuclease subunit S [Enterococcus gallinarum]|uniref:restriction endonuclease subunit S n=1 Tax=Enterococcus gallinarum TaxID=1353 RepID=UPI00255B0368|nr:restriction endonuclease subunit S [Enterococcus gallinarum]MDL4881801.1 restriction endonuclease subunit S [Enterococcus gallinarum]MDL4893847.1 restriction endonuclease subunit S [Enterococcus gallinarum]
MENVSSSNGLEKRPKLRFPSFDEPWKSALLSDYFSKNIKKNADGAITNVICNSAKQGLIPQRDYFDKYIANSDNTDGYYIIETNDFVYNPRKSTDAPYGPISSYKYPEAGIVSPLYLCFRAKQEINPLYFEWYFRSSAWHRYIYMSGDSGARHDRVSIKDETFFAMPINIPSAQEQDRIALFLNAIEQRIEKQRSLVEALKKYKRGLLTYAFEEMTLSDDADSTTYLFSEIAQRRKEKYNPDCNVEYPCIELEHIEQGTGRLLGSVSSKTQSSIKTVAKNGDVLFGKLRPYLRKFAFAEQDIVCSSEIWAFVPSKYVIPKYLYYLVQTEHFLRVANISSGTKMPRAEWANIEKEPFDIPYIPNQEKVVSILEAVDKKISVSGDSLRMLLNFRDGLLQQLFI